MITLEKSEQSWISANQSYLQTAIYLVRLRLKKRICWLRTQWSQGSVDPLQGFASVVTDKQADWLLVGTDWEAESAFYGNDDQTREISEEIGLLEAALAQAEEHWINAGNPLPMTTMTKICGLSQFDQQLLWLCLAPAIDASFSSLFAYVQDNANRIAPTLQLAVNLFARDEQSRFLAFKQLLPTAPMRQFGLLQPFEANGELISQPLRLVPRVASFLQGIQQIDNQLEGMVKWVEEIYLPASQIAIAHQLAQWLSQQSSPMAVNLIGNGDADGVAAHCCRHAGLQLLAIDVAEAIRQNQTANLSSLERALLREAALLPCAFYLDFAQLDASEQKMALRLIERLPALIFFRSERPLPLDRPGLVQPIPHPTSAEQKDLWLQALGELSPNDAGIQALVQQFDFNGASIKKVADTAWRQTQLRFPHNGVSITIDDLWQASRAFASPKLAQLAQPIDSVYTWDDIILPAELLTQLREIEMQTAHRHRVYEQWGFGEKLSRGRGISALFAGASGTGKTMSAEILANALRLDLYRIDLSSVVSKYIGETEKNLKSVFDAAEKSGAILFFDEADALFGKRTEVKDSHDRYANIEINYLLQRMESYRGLAILATNRKSDIDRAFLRRLRYLLNFPFPDFNQRELIWRKAFPKQTPLGELNFGALAQLEVPGGNIKNIVLNGAFLAAEAGTAVTMAHLMRSAKREYAKIDKMIKAAEFGRFYDNEESER